MANTLRVYLFESVPERPKDATSSKRRYHATILNGQEIPPTGAVYALNEATISDSSVPLLIAGIRRRINGTPIEVIPHSPYQSATAFIPSSPTSKSWDYRRLNPLPEIYQKSIKSSLETR